MRPVLAEMGGKNPAFVTASADLHVAASGVARSAFGLQGQKCSAASKAYVEREIFDDFVGALVETSNKLVIGDPRRQDVFMGPVINSTSLDRFTKAAGEAGTDGSIILGGKQNGCVILGGGSPKNFYLQGQPTLWEVYGIPKGGNDYFIQITTDQVVWGGLSGATPAEAVSWGKVNPSVLPDTAVAYCDSTIAFPLFCEYAVGHKNGRRKRKALLSKRLELVRELEKEARKKIKKSAK